MGYKIIHDQNYGGTLKDEKLVSQLPLFHNKKYAQLIVDAINLAAGENCGRYYRLVDENYVLTSDTTV